MSPLRTSLCGHDVPAKDVLVEDMMSKQDVIKSMCRHHVLDGDVLGRDVLNEDVLGGDIMSTQGRPRADVPVEDIHVCFYFCPLVFILSKFETFISRNTNLYKHLLLQG